MIMLRKTTLDIFFWISRKTLDIATQAGFFFLYITAGIRGSFRRVNEGYRVSTLIRLFRTPVRASSSEIERCATYQGPNSYKFDNVSRSASRCSGALQALAGLPKPVAERDALGPGGRRAPTARALVEKSRDSAQRGHIFAPVSRTRKLAAQGPHVRADGSGWAAAWHLLPIDFAHPGILSEARKGTCSSTDRP